MCVRLRNNVLIQPSRTYFQPAELLALFYSVGGYELSLTGSQSGTDFNIHHLTADIARPYTTYAYARTHILCSGHASAAPALPLLSQNPHNLLHSAETLDPILALSGYTGKRENKTSGRGYSNRCHVGGQEISDQLVTVREEGRSAREEGRSSIATDRATCAMLRHSARRPRWRAGMRTCNTQGPDMRRRKGKK